MSSRCCDSSSTILSADSFRRLWTWARSHLRQSGIAFRDAVHGNPEFAPALALRFENGLALGRQPVKAPLAFARLFDPAPLNPSALFQPVQEVIKRCQIQREDTLRANCNHPADIVTVTGFVFQARQD